MNQMDMIVLAYRTRCFRSAWVGIAVLSAQNVLCAVLVLTLVVD